MDRFRRFLGWTATILLFPLVLVLAIVLDVCIYVVAEWKLWRPLMIDTRAELEDAERYRRGEPSDRGLAFSLEDEAAKLKGTDDGLAWLLETAAERLRG